MMLIGLLISLSLAFSAFVPTSDFLQALDNELLANSTLNRNQIAFALLSGMIFDDDATQTSYLTIGTDVKFPVGEEATPAQISLLEQWFTDNSNAYNSTTPYHEATNSYLNNEDLDEEVLSLLMDSLGEDPNSSQSTPAVTFRDVKVARKLCWDSHCHGMFYCAHLGGKGCICGGNKVGRCTRDRG